MRLCRAIRPNPRGWRSRWAGTSAPRSGGTGPAGGCERRSLTTRTSWLPGAYLFGGGPDVVTVPFGTLERSVVELLDAVGDGGT